MVGIKIDKGVFAGDAHGMGEEVDFVVKEILFRGRGSHAARILRRGRTGRESGRRHGRSVRGGGNRQRAGSVRRGKGGRSRQRVGSVRGGRSCSGERTAADNKARVKAKFFITIPPLMFEQSISRQKQKVKLKGEIVATGAGGKAPARV